MTTPSIRFVVPWLLSTLLLVACERSGGDIWEDTKTASRHVTRGVKSLGGKQVESRQVASHSEFAGGQQQEFIALDKPTDYRHMTRGKSQTIVESVHDAVLPQPKESPGDPGSSIPSIDKFRHPDTDRELSSVFKNVHFPYNSSVVKGTENLQTIADIAAYLKKNPSTYIFVEGHCDKRGAQAYNLALGARRANGVRQLLVNEGVDPERVFTISYGREKPLVMGDDEVAYQENRRAQFKIFHKHKG